MDNLKILEQVKHALKQALPKYHAAFAYVFGSVAKNQTHAESDLDIAIGFAEKLSEENYSKMLAEINHMLNIPTEKLDVKNFSELPLAVRFRIIRDGQLVFLQDEKIHREMAFKTLDYYHDQYPVMQKFSKLFFNQMAAK